MKKLSLLLAVVMLFTAVASAALADQMTVAWWGNQTRTDRTQAALDLYSAQNEGVTFDVQPGAWADYWSQLAVAASGYELPAIIQMDYTYLNQFVENGLLADLTPYVESGVMDISKMSEGITASGCVGDGLYAICLGVNAPALLYNKTLLDGAGITVKDNMTMDEFFALSKEIYEKTGVKTNVGFGTNMVLNYMVRGLGNELFTDGKLSATAEDIEYYFSIYEKGIKEGWMVGSEVFAETTVGTVEQDPMVYGNSPENMSWCAFFWSNQMQATQDAAPEGVELGITSWPSPDVSKSNYLKPSQFFSVSRDAKDPEAAAKVVNYFLNSVECNNILLGERGIPAASDVAAAIAPQLNEVNQKIIVYINDVVSNCCSALPAAEPAEAPEFFKVMNEMVETLCYGQCTAAEATAELLDAASSIFAK